MREQKRTVPLLRQFGLTITSRELLRNGSIGSISYENGVVKLDGVPLSEVTGENVGSDYYTLALRDHKNIKASPALGTPEMGPVKSAGNASEKSVLQNEGNVKRYSLKEYTDEEKKQHRKVQTSISGIPTSGRRLATL